MCFFDWFDKPEKPKAPPPPPPVPKVKQETAPSSKQVQKQVEVAKKQEDTRVRKFQGQQATLLTSPFGVSEEANVKRKTLLGQ